jgi:poly-gamma-glutamate synthesis protein (capsule biosynthesis protein)
VGDGFVGRSGPIPPAIRREMAGASWRDDPRCPPFADLALLELSYRDFAGVRHTGELVVAARWAEPIVGVFARLYDAGFPLGGMRRVDAFGGDDDRSMAANNCSGFNFRTIAGTDALSMHARGVAVDLNPVQNPYLVASRIYPPAAAGFLDRTDVRPGMIVRPGPVVDAFAAIGWGWGGDWTSRKDYHHFAAPPDAA